MIRKNVTSIFMVPTLKIGKKKLNSNGFVNAYIKDSRRDVQYDECIYLLFHPENLDGFREFLDEEYERTKSIVDEYDYEEGFVVVVYKLDEQFKEDFNLVKQGKYSKTSKEFQENFPKFVTIEKKGLQKEEISLQFRIFNKTTDLQEFWEEKIGVRFNSEQEFWEGFHEENEILDLDDIKKKFNNKLEYESK
jgi:hypothetical protein